MFLGKQLGGCGAAQWLSPATWAVKEEEHLDVALWSEASPHRLQKSPPLPPHPQEPCPSSPLFVPWFSSLALAGPLLSQCCPAWSPFALCPVTPPP